MGSIRFSQDARLRIVYGLVCGLAFSACSNSSFNGSNKVPAVATSPKPNSEPPVIGNNQPGEVKSPIVGLSCDAEISRAPLAVTLVATAPDHFVDVSPLCSSVKTGTTTTSVKQPVDVVFVLDVTGSMQGNIDTVKRNAVSFSKKLLERGWDARFSAIGYRDNPMAGVPGSTTLIGGSPDPALPNPIPFGGAAALEASINTADWTAIGGHNEQEAGQDAIASAVSQFAASGRPSVLKVILQVSDVASYAIGGSDDSTDFSVGALVAKLKSASVGKIKLFSSVGGKAVGSVLPPASQQADDIRAQAGIEGGNLPFPLTDTVLLDQFLSRFEVVNSSVETTCRLLSVSFDGAAPSSGTRVSLGKADKVTASVGKLLRVNRCCSVVAAGVGAKPEPTTCASPEERTIALSPKPVR